MLADLLSDSKAVPFRGCMSQLFFEHLFLGTFRDCPPCRCACDHYMDICRPLHHVPIMDHHTCCLLVGVCQQGFAPLIWTDPSHSLTPAPWPQPHGSLMCDISPDKTFLHWHFPLGFSKGGVTPVIICNAGGILHGHPGLLEDSEFYRKEKIPDYL